jgi:hypothetical protein
MQGQSHYSEYQIITVKLKIIKFKKIFRHLRVQILNIKLHEKNKK